MSLEDAIGQLTAAVTRNSELLQLLADRTTLNGSAKPSTATVAPVEPVVNTPVAPPAEPEQKKRGPGRPPKAKVITEMDLRKAFGSYMAGDPDPDVKEARKLKVQAMLNYMGFNKATEIAEDRRQEALDYLAVLVAGGTPNYPGAEEEDAEEDEDEEALI